MHHSAERNGMLLYVELIATRASTGMRQRITAPISAFVVGMVSAVAGSVQLCKVFPSQNPAHGLFRSAA
jgi:hypothetical protein